MYVVVQYLLFATVQVALLYYMHHTAKNALEFMCFKCLDKFFVTLDANKYISEAGMSNVSVFVRRVGAWFIVGRKS